MPPTKGRAPSARKETAGRKPQGARPANPAQAKPELVSVTIDAANGRVVSLERVDETGARREFSPEEIAAAVNGEATIEALVEQAFEAGIGVVLGESGEEEPQESSAENELSHILLQSLLERSRARTLFAAGVLNKAIVGTLVAQTAPPQPATAH